MPYIKEESRIALNPIIDELAKQIVEQANATGGEIAYAGILNYTCTRLAMQVIKLKFTEIRYGIIATTTGVFKNIADEFYRRVGVPYEKLQMGKNGDVDLYAEFTAEIAKQ